jgi:hypothetical protein
LNESNFKDKSIDMIFTFPNSKTYKLFMIYILNVWFKPYPKWLLILNPRQYFDLCNCSTIVRHIIRQNSRLLASNKFIYYLLWHNFSQATQFLNRITNINAYIRKFLTVGTSFFFVKSTMYNNIGCTTYYILVMRD